MTVKDMFSEGYLRVNFRNNNREYIKGRVFKIENNICHITGDREGKIYEIDISKVKLDYSFLRGSVASGIKLMSFRNRYMENPIISLSKNSISIQDDFVQLLKSIGEKNQELYFDFAYIDQNLVVYPKSEIGLNLIEGSQKGEFEGIFQFLTETYSKHVNKLDKIDLVVGTFFGITENFEPYIKLDVSHQTMHKIMDMQANEPQVVKAKVEKTKKSKKSGQKSSMKTSNFNNEVMPEKTIEEVYRQTLQDRVNFYRLKSQEDIEVL